MVEEALNETRSDCVSAVASSRQQLGLMLAHRVGQQSASKLFKLCQPIDPEQPLDLQNLYETIASNFAGVVQYNKDNRLSGGSSANITVSNEISLDMQVSAECFLFFFVIVQGN